MSETANPAKSDFEFRRLNRLLDAAILLNSTLELKEMTEIILEIVRDQVPIERVTVFRVDKSRGLVRSLVAQDVPQEIVLSMGSGIAGTVAASGETLDIPDAYADSRFNSNFDRIFKYRTNDLFAMPIVNGKGEVVGVLELLNRTRPISPSDLEFLQRISVYIGIALENAALYQEARTKEQLEKELVRLRDRLANLERSSTMAQVLLGVLHQINNPLAIAMGHLSLLKIQFAMDDQGSQRLRKIESAVERAAEVARRFVHLAEAETNKHQSIDAGKLLREVLDLRIPEWQEVGIDSTISMDEAPIIGDPRQLQLVFMHLLINAEEACLRRSSRGHIAVRVVHDIERQQVRIEIQDNGPGIPAESRSRLFEPFFTTKTPGSGIGLGLAVVRSIMHRHDGRVSFETQEGEGTTFIIELPARSTVDVYSA